MVSTLESILDRLAPNLAVDQRPAAVVVAGSAADVAETVRAAIAAGLRVAPQGTGHGASVLGDLSGTILLRTTSLRGVSVDPGRQVARVEAGVLWQEVTARLREIKERVDPENVLRSNHEL
jgi:FAD/FMN-containing dehydrogenase